MTVTLRYGDMEVRWGLPVSAIHVQDILDRMNVQSGREIEFMFSKYDMIDMPANILDKWHKADIYKLNVFADCFQRLEDHQKAGFKSVLMRNPESSIDDMIAMTYGIDCVPVYPAKNYAELGEIAVENEMLPEIEECSDAVIGLLDYEKVGKLLAERDNGLFVDGYYCMPDSYEEPDISLTIEVPDKRFFRVLVSPSATTTDQAQWFNLPEDIRRLRAYSAEHNSTPEQMYITEVEAVLPNITDAAYYEAYWVEDMIALSEQLAGMRKSDVVKLKAVMETENIQTFSGAREAIDSLNEYEFDSMVQDESQYGKVYACRVFPTNFDWSILENCDMNDFGKQVLARKHGELTEYGVLSGKGQKLYTTLTAESETMEEAEKLTEDEAEAEDESEAMSMGGMT
ncbi:antirestriction protein ArdA [Ruminococcus flavefaciens]|uniref:Antirestriction protein (ArdA) n=1 Tax=Ruminococcus flavefaciens TaxID=1265 RepID=A0A315XT29_RUMFL|nr:hypothetical protein [Ruminococcus flavefaciens]PWJ09875.1 hypothetical protein IE37_03309 [Ruminococcus flavefaciens]SSA52166.1 hypothetical protein SAMN02910325_03309 [Ruminococcus flavefaciens]